MKTKIFLYIISFFAIIGLLLWAYHAYKLVGFNLESAPF